LSGRTKSCGCINYSIGEKNIAELLEQNNIAFIREYKFQDLNNYRYDFYLPEYNRLIEFDGKQHYIDSGTWDKDTLKERQDRDKEKNQYALNRNIDLVRIPYWQRDKITLDMILGDYYLVRKE
jgi:very-short-patch-repair endonuclease